MDRADETVNVITEHYIKHKCAVDYKTLAELLGCSVPTARRRCAAIVRDMRIGCMPRNHQFAGSRDTYMPTRSHLATLLEIERGAK